MGETVKIMIESGILKPSGSVQLKGGTYAELSSSNPLLACRELCVEVDTGKAKVGNGTDYYNSLPYIGGISSETWTFELEDGTTVTKEVASWTSRA